MPELSFYGASDDLVELEGALKEEYELPAGDVWTATIQDTEGNTAQLRASYCKDNPDGWHVEVTDEYGECPWPQEKTTRPDSPDDEEPDPMIILTVPRGVVIQEDQ